MIDFIQSIWRVAETTTVLTKTGFDFLLGDRPPAPALLRKIFERLGATYIKLGQFIASAPSLFPFEYVEEFQKCLDKADPLDFSTIKIALEESYGIPYNEIKENYFASIDETPLASASIAQVHSAVLNSGESVVLKIKRPGVENILLTDLNFIFITTKILEWLTPGLDRISLSAMVQEIQKTMLEETDFLQEAKNLKEFAAFLKKTGNTRAVVPLVYDKVTRPGVLVMERLYGVPLTDLQSISKYTDHPEETLIIALNTWFASLVACDFFHADVHAGNLMVLESGEVAFIDFGIVGRIPKPFWNAMDGFFQGITLKNHKLMADSLIQMGAADKVVDREAFGRDLAAIFSELEKIDPKQIAEGDVPDAELNTLFLRIARVSEQNGIRLPREFALLIKQFLYFDRYVRILAPELNVLADERIKRLGQE